MKHIKVENLIAFHQNELTEEEAQLVRVHIQECPHCQAELDLLQELDQVWHNEEPDILIKEHSLEQIMLHIASKPNAKTWMKNNKANWKTIFHFSVSAAATFLFIKQGIFYDISSVSNYLVHSFLNAPDHLQYLTNKGITMFETNLIDYFSNNR